jgi:hydrogenase/urease accessory protein HupE
MKPIAKRVLCNMAAWMLLWAAGSTAWAHKGSDAYLLITDQPTLSLRYAVAIKDLEMAVNVDANGDGQVTWGEVKAATPAVGALLTKEIGLSGTAALAWEFDGLEARGDGAYMRMKATPDIHTGAAPALRYTLFKTEDASHRLLVAGQLQGKDLLLTLSPTQTQATVLGDSLHGAPTQAPSASTQNDGDVTAAWRSLRQYFSLGVHHLLGGYDHMAFLLALVLPLHVRLWPRPGARNLPPAPLRSQATEWSRMLRTVTAFTLGHSVTLIFATLGYTSVSARWVEPAIAASIGISALLNIYPQRWLRTEVLAGVFGLVHGYGFAGLLIEAAAPSGLLGWALGGFNLGVEAGQLIAVSGWLFVSQPLIDKPVYDRLVVRAGSWLLFALATLWFLQRILPVR